MENVITIPACGDNFIYLFRYGPNDAFVVDPSVSEPVLQRLNADGLNLRMALITHHHWDHLGGVEDLKKKTGCQIIGADARRISGIDKVIADGDIIKTGQYDIRVISTPGHTKTSVCYYLEPSDDNVGILWTGDTMFIGGCGRIFECNAETMLDSLLRLADLPNDTLVYCGHDYTIENYEFALTIEPANPIFKQRLDEVKGGDLSVPSTIGQEKQTNIFLQTERDVKVFAKL
ncbi:MAG: hydroxyacylglutathione hydrolase, partial [Planctomycetota bacterium]